MQGKTTGLPAWEVLHAVWWASSVCGNTMGTTMCGPPAQGGIQILGGTTIPWLSLCVVWAFVFGLDNCKLSVICVHDVPISCLVESRVICGVSASVSDVRFVSPLLLCVERISDSVGAQLHGMNSSIVKMKEERDDINKQISEIFTNIKRKSLTWQKIRKTRSKKSRGTCGIPLRNICQRSCNSWMKSTTKTGMTMENATWMSHRVDHTCFHSFQERWRKKQIRQVSEHVEKRVTRKKVEDIAFNGRRWKFFVTRERDMSDIAFMRSITSLSIR